jgi:hypothetical protein
LADLSARQRRAERRAGSPERTVLVRIVRTNTVDGDKSPAESADKSAHSKALGARLTKYARKFEEAFLDLRLIFAAWFAPSPTVRRYRVTPRANPAAFRHNLLLGIQLELRRAGFAGSREIVGRTTL